MMSRTAEHVGSILAGGESMAHPEHRKILKQDGDVPLGEHSDAAENNARLDARTYAMDVQWYRCCRRQRVRALVVKRKRRRKTKGTT